jgi:hypothetical protein
MGWTSRPPSFFGHLKAVLVAQKIRGVQQKDVQRMGLDPFAAVDQAAQVAEGTGHLDAQGLLHGMHRAHLVGHRADAADAGGDVRGLGEVAAP